jgi:hypothetical protein
VKIQIRNYNWKHFNGKFQKVYIYRSYLKQKFIDIILFLFKTINYKHTHSKDEYGRQYITEIIDIRGIRTCAYETIGGQVYISQFMWKFGKYYI